jgi:hypothetical protein
VKKGVRKTRNEYGHEDRTFKQSSDRAKEDEATAEAVLKSVKTIFAKYTDLYGRYDILPEKPLPS